MNRPITSFEIGEQSAAKPLAPFGSAVVQRPVTQGRAEADQGGLNRVTFGGE